MILVSPCLYLVLPLNSVNSIPQYDEAYLCEPWTVKKKHRHTNHHHRLMPCILQGLSRGTLSKQHLQTCFQASFLIVAMISKELRACRETKDQG